MTISRSENVSIGCGRAADGGRWAVGGGVWMLGVGRSVRAVCRRQWVAEPRWLFAVAIQCAYPSGEPAVGL